MRFTCGAGGVFDWVGALEGGVHQEFIVPQVLHLQSSAALRSRVTKSLTSLKGHSSVDGGPSSSPIPCSSWNLVPSESPVSKWPRA